MHPLEGSTTATNDESGNRISPRDAKELGLFKELLWGSNIQNNSVTFKNWSIAFEFNYPEEPSALIQHLGGYTQTIFSLPHYNSHHFRTLQCYCNMSSLHSKTTHRTSRNSSIQRSDRRQV